jgi:hypothetical protein
LPLVDRQSLFDADVAARCWHFCGSHGVERFHENRNGIDIRDEFCWQISVCLIQSSLFGGIWLETGEQATSPTPISLPKEQRNLRHGFRGLGHGVKRLTNLQTPQFVLHNVVSRDC